MDCQRAHDVSALFLRVDGESRSAAASWDGVMVHADRTARRSNMIMEAPVPDLGTAIGLLARLAAPAARSRAERNEAVVRTLATLRLNPARPPGTFDALYVYALVEFGMGKSQHILDFFRDEYLVQAFRKAFESGDDDPLRREADLIYQRWTEEGKFEQHDYDPRRDLVAFTAVFEECLRRSRTPVEVQLSRQLDDLHDTVSLALDTLHQLPTVDDIWSYVRGALEQSREVEVPRSSTLVVRVADSQDSESILQSLSHRMAEYEIRAVCRSAASDGKTSDTDRHPPTGQDVDLRICVFRSGYEPLVVDEYDSAKAARQPLLVFVCAPIRPRDTRLTAFLRREKLDAEGTGASTVFRDDAHLVDLAAQTTRRWISRAYRRITAQVAEGSMPEFELMRGQKQAAHLRAVCSFALSEGSPLDLLSERLTSWFSALRYETETYDNESDRFIDSIIHVPGRRGYDRVLVRAVAGEAQAGDVSAADEHRASIRCDEVWLVANARVSPAARIRAGTADSAAYCYTFDELLDVDADFEPYLEWLDAEVTARQIDVRYVPLACRKQEDLDGTGIYSQYGEEEGWMEGYIDRWLADPSKEHVSVLGEFGTGKSWFTLHYAWMLAKRYRQARAAGTERPRLPLVIPLRDYSKAVTVESLFSELFFRQHHVKLATYAAFEQLNRFGKLLLIFDGFDEMAARVDRQAMINNFWQLAQVVVPGAKAILTCRSEHFPNSREERDLLGAQLRASTAVLTGEPPQFEQLHVLTMGDAQVKAMLAHRTDADTVSRIMANGQLLDLLRRPVMTELVLDALPEVEAGEPVSLTRIYMYAIRRKMDRDIRAERTFTSLADKLFFLCELSWEMYKTETMSVNYRTVPDAIRRCFGPRVQLERDLDHWHYDMLGQTILIRNADGDYAPAHRSFLEFFVAYKIAGELGVLPAEFCQMARQPAEDAASPPAERTWIDHFQGDHPRSLPPLERFARASLERLCDLVVEGSWVGLATQMMAEMASADRAFAVGRLSEVLRAQAEPSRQGRPELISRAAYLMTQMDPSALRSVQLEGVDWASVDMDYGMEERLDCTSTVLRDASFVGATLKNVILVDADLRGADLTDCRLGDDGSPTGLDMQEESKLIVALPNCMLAVDCSTGNVSSADVDAVIHSPGAANDLLLTRALRRPDLSAASFERVGLPVRHRLTFAAEQGVVRAQNRDEMSLEVRDPITLDLLSTLAVPARANIRSVAALHGGALLVFLAIGGESLVGVSATGSELWEVSNVGPYDFLGASADESAARTDFVAGRWPAHISARHRENEPGAADEPGDGALTWDVWQCPLAGTVPELVGGRRIPHDVPSDPLAGVTLRSTRMRFDPRGYFLYMAIEEDSTLKACAFHIDRGKLWDFVEFSDAEARVDDVTMSLDGSRVVFAGSDLRMYQVVAGQLQEVWASPRGPGGRFTAATFSPLGNRVAVAQSSGLVTVLDSATRSELWRGSTSQLYTGADFRGASGLTAESQDFLRLSGAILE